MDKSFGTMRLTTVVGLTAILMSLGLSAGPVEAQTDRPTPAVTEEITTPPRVVPDAPPASSTLQPASDPAPEQSGVPSPASNRSQQQVVSGDEMWWEPYAQPLISGGAALFGAIVGGLVARANMTASNNQRANEVEIGQLQTKLNDFYGRFRLISEENKLISLEFKRRQGGGDFRTLVALLDPKWLPRLSQADKTIVGAMIENGVELRKLIRERAGLVDVTVLPYLAKVSAHFAVLDLAYKGLLEDDPERFLQYVYPQKLDGVLELEVTRLTQRIALLLHESDKRHGPIVPLTIPDDLKL